MSNSLVNAIGRVKAGSRNEADIQTIAAAVESGKLILANAPGSVGVGGDVADSLIITGDNNVAGDNNIIIYGADAQTIQAVLVTTQERWAALRPKVFINTANLEGKQQLAIALTEEMGASGLDNSDQFLQAIQARLQPTPPLFREGLCKGRLLSPKPNQYFVSHGFSPDLLADWRQALEEGLAQTSDDRSTLQPYFSGDTMLGGFRLCGVCEQLFTSRFSMFLLPPSQDRNVYLELGIAIGLGAPFFLIQHYEAKIPEVLEGLSRYAKGGLFRTMRRELAGQIEEYDFGVVHFIADLPQIGSQPKYLVAAGELIDDEDFEGSIMDALQSSFSHLEAVSLTDQLKNAKTSGWVLNQLVQSIQMSRFAIYRVDEDCLPTTFLALGISIGLNRPFLMVHRTNRDVPLDLRGMGMYQFSNFVALQREIIARHQEFFNRYAM